MTAEVVQGGAVPCGLQLRQQLQGAQGSPREVLCCCICLLYWRQGSQQLKGGHLLLKKVLHSPASTQQPTSQHCGSVSKSVPVSVMQTSDADATRELRLLLAGTPEAGIASLTVLLARQLMV